MIQLFVFYTEISKLKVKGCKKIDHTNMNPEKKKAVVALLISNKVLFGENKLLGT